MSQLFEWVSRLFASWKFWIVVPPWDAALRVRFGRRAVLLAPGPHWRIPAVDQVMLVNTRLRVATAPIVTLPSRELHENKVRVVRVTVGYRVEDPLKAVLRYEMPESAVQGLTMAFASDDGSSAESVKKLLEERLAHGGIVVEFVTFVEDVEIPALRVVQGEWGVQTHNGYREPGKLGAPERY